MKWLTLLLLCSLASCAPKAVVVAPMAPAVVRVRAQVQAAAASSARLEKSVGVIQSGVSAMGEEIGRALQTADALRVRGSASQAELDDQWQALAGLQTRNLFLEAEVKSAAVNATEQKALRETAAASLVELESAAVVTDKGVETLKTQIVKQAGDAALGKTMRRFVWVAVIGSLALGILWIVLKVIKPL